MISQQSYSLTLRVYYEDTDALGIVYYANYLKFMERARTEWLRQLGLELQHPGSFYFVVKQVQLDFHAPAKLNDNLQVSCAITRVGKVSLSCSQQIHRGETLLCEAQVRLACIGGDFRPTALPQALRR